MKEILYRVDKRLFSLGEIIKPQADFEGLLEAEKKELENLLNKKRPENIPQRNRCLFLFRDLLGALLFYSKYGGNIYSVELLSPIYHCGDMNKLDNILDLFRFIDIDEDKDGILDAVTNEYWKRNTHTFCPCYEILVDSAKVVNVLCGNDCHLPLKEELKLKGSIEKTSLYKELIKNI